MTWTVYVHVPRTLYYFYHHGIQYLRIIVQNVRNVLIGHHDQPISDHFLELIWTTFFYMYVTTLYVKINVCKQSISYVCTCTL